jgi:hypothetical protein
MLFRFSESGARAISKLIKICGRFSFCNKQLVGKFRSSQKANINPNPKVSAINLYHLQVKFSHDQLKDNVFIVIVTIEIEIAAIEDITTR